MMAKRNSARNFYREPPSLYDDPDYIESEDRPLCPECAEFKSEMLEWRNEAEKAAETNAGLRNRISAPKRELREAYAEIKRLEGCVLRANEQNRQIYEKLKEYGFERERKEFHFHGWNPHVG